MKYILIALAVLFFALPASRAFADDKGGGSSSGGDDVSYKQKTVYDFDDDVVEGDLVRPDGEMIDTRKAAKHSSLITIRENFIPEMLKMAEDM